MILSPGTVEEPVVSEADCFAFFYSMKWPDGFRCPRCGHPNAYTIQTRRLPLYQCHSCGHQTTLIAGTIMERSRTPLSKWYTAFQLVADSSSVNAVRLSGLLQVTYKTAWSMLRKIRYAISNSDAKQQLAGIVRAGLTFYGRANFHPFVPRPQEHPVVVGASFQMDGQPVYIKMKVVPEEHMNDRMLRRSGEAAFIEEHVQANTFDAQVLKRFQFNRVKQLPELFREAKKWINQTFHGIGPAYLQEYCDEFCFRINQSFRKVSALHALCSLCLSASSRRKCS